VEYSDVALSPKIYYFGGISQESGLKRVCRNNLDGKIRPSDI